jgi:hypothetical protein
MVQTARRAAEVRAEAEAEAKRLEAAKAEAEAEAAKAAKRLAAEVAADARAERVEAAKMKKRVARAKELLMICDKHFQEVYEELEMTLLCLDAVKDYANGLRQRYLGLPPVHLSDDWWHVAHVYRSLEKRTKFFDPKEHPGSTDGAPPDGRA